MRIGELAARCGVPTRTIRFYERRHLLLPALRTAGGYRDYDEAAVARLCFVRQAQAAGLSLSEIASIIDLRDEGITPCEHVGRLLDAKLAETRDRIRSLRALETELGRLVERAQTLDPAECADPAICRILEP